MKKFGKVKIYRSQANQVIKALTDKLKEVQDDLNIPRTDDKHRTKLMHTEKAKNQVMDLLEKMADTLTQYEAEAQEMNKKARFIEAHTLAQRASLLAPLAANMSDDELLNLYHSRHGNRADRLLLDDIFSVRIDSNPKKAETLAPKFERLKQSLIDELPEAERKAREELEAVSLMQTYGDVCFDEVQLSLQEATRGSLKLEQQIARKRLATDANSIEKEFGL